MARNKRQRLDWTTHSRVLNKSKRRTPRRLFNLVPPSKRAWCRQLQCTSIALPGLNVLEIGPNSLGNEIKVLANKPYVQSILAIDIDPTAVANLSARLAKDLTVEQQQKISVVNSDIVDVALTADFYHLIFSSLTLSFLSPNLFSDTLAKLAACLAINGLIVCDVFGEKHQFREAAEMANGTYLSHEQVQAEFARFFRNIEIKEILSEIHLANPDAQGNTTAMAHCFAVRAQK